MISAGSHRCTHSDSIALVWPKGRREMKYHKHSTKKTTTAWCILASLVPLTVSAQNPGGWNQGLTPFAVSWDLEMSWPSGCDRKRRAMCASAAGDPSAVGSSLGWPGMTVPRTKLKSMQVNFWRSSRRSWSDWTWNTLIYNHLYVTYIYIYIYNYWFTWCLVGQAVSNYTGSDYVGTPSRSESENDRYRLQVFLFIVDKFHHVPSFCHNSRLFEHLALLVQAHAFAVCQYSRIFRVLKSGRSLNWKKLGQPRCMIWVFDSLSLNHLLQSGMTFLSERFTGGACVLCSPGLQNVQTATRDTCSHVQSRATR